MKNGYIFVILLHIFTIIRPSTVQENIEEIDKKFLNFHSDNKKIVLSVYDWLLACNVSMDCTREEIEQAIEHLSREDFYIINNYAHQYVFQMFQDCADQKHDEMLTCLIGSIVYTNNQRYELIAQKQILDHDILSNMLKQNIIAFLVAGSIVRRFLTRIKSTTVLQV
ncbi:hypothetical protein EKK58_07125 [Candidatus Dependentiae bacterium]|nr:MAG: hypothetical protein EKK58_07125 [Candidatus Dependentiae bacterium]